MCFENSVLERSLLHGESEQKQRGFLLEFEGWIAHSEETQEGFFQHRRQCKANLQRGQQLWAPGVKVIRPE